MFSLNRPRPWACAWILGALLVIGGCNKPERAKEPEDTGPSAKGNTPTTGAAAKKVIDKPLNSVVKGKVILDGNLPEPPSLLAVMEKSPDKVTCCDKAPKKDLVSQTWMVSSNKEVQNVIVYLKPAAKGEVFKKKEYEGDVIVDQPFCQYVPHVAVARPGEKIVFKNSAPVNHNVKFDSTVNGNFSKPMSPDSKLPAPLSAEKLPLYITCDSHKWMSGYIWPTDNPYTVVTNEKGEFEIKDVPTGVELEIWTWHESDQRPKSHGKITTKEGSNDKELKLTATAG